MRRLTLRKIDECAMKLIAHSAHFLPMARTSSDDPSRIFRLQTFLFVAFARRRLCMNESSDGAKREEPEPHYEVWLAERELLDAATAVRDLRATSRSPARVAYEAAWLRFMVALCNLPIAERPLEVERMIDALRTAHVLQSRGELHGSDSSNVAPTPPRGTSRIGLLVQKIPVHTEGPDS